MDFMKVFDQTVREIKREVNLKVLKVPEIEQKVLDATDDEPWGPHGSALAEIAQATKKFTECQMVMNVLWTRLRETGKDWRYVYKALAVIEYLVSHGSERAVDDIIEHTYQISSLSSFEYVEPSGKDQGINVRKKAETIVNLLNNKDKIQEVRNKAAANRDKYFGVSSTGVSHKSTAAAYGSTGLGSSDRYRNTRDSERFDYTNYEDDKDAYKKPTKKGNQQDNTMEGSSHSSSKTGSSAYSSKKLNVPSQLSNANDFDDFDPRGTSSTKSSAGNSNQVDLFGDSLMGDFFDAPASANPGPSDLSAMNKEPSDVDLFADATFVSAPPPVEPVENFQKQTEVDLFSSIPSAAPQFPAAVPATVDLFSSPDPVVPAETNPTKSVSTDTSTVDPFAAVPLNNFDGSDPFGAFTFSEPAAAAPSQNQTDESGLGDSSAKLSAGANLTSTKKDGFQVKSGIWADSLSRGIIDLNIAAPKKVSLADVGVVGALSDGADEREKGLPTSYYMGRAMGTGSGLSKTGFPPAQSASMDDDFFSSYASQPYQYNSSKK